LEEFPILVCAARVCSPLHTPKIGLLTKYLRSTDCPISIQYTLQKDKSMSEIINNRQQRIEIMKSLMRQLHSGATEEQVKHQLETMLDEADYSDVFMMEVQLVQEGISAEKIQELCDTHTRVLKKHLDLSETPRNGRRASGQYLRAGKSRTDENHRPNSPSDEETGIPARRTDATEQMRVIQGLLNSLMDVDKHYRRKEYLLFPFFEKNDLPGPPMVMWGKHDEVRNLLKQTIAGLQQAETLTAAEAKAYNLFTISPAIEAIDDMMYKEEKIMFPTALDLLTEQEWYEIYLQSDEYGYCLFAPEFEWTPEGGFHKEIKKTVSGRRTRPDADRQFLDRGIDCRFQRDALRPDLCRQGRHGTLFQPRQRAHLRPLTRDFGAQSAILSPAQERPHRQPDCQGFQGRQARPRPLLD
jgi:hypothetical protein